MAQNIKYCPHSAGETAPATTPLPLSDPPACSIKITSSQPSMHRHIHPIPLRDSFDVRQSNQYSTLLQTLEQQNALLTDLLSAVNGLAALVCSRRSS